MMMMMMMMMLCTGYVTLTMQTFANLKPPNILEESHPGWPRASLDPTSHTGGVKLSKRCYA